MTSTAHLFVTDYGAKPGTAEDATAAVAQTIAALPPAGGVIDFPKGEYHFHREKGAQRDLYLSNSDVANPRSIAILLETRKSVVIRGNGSRLVFHDRIIPFAVLNCKDIEIDGFTVDWDRPLMSQGRVIQSGITGFTLQVDKGLYPYSFENGKLLFTDKTWKRRPWAYMEFDPATKGVAYNTGDAGITDGDINKASVSEPQPGQIRFSFPCTRFPKVGNIIVIRHGVRDHAGTFILGSKHVRLSNVAYRHTSGLGVLSQYSSDLTFDHVEVAPDPKSTRLFAGHDDGFHFSNCRGEILVDHCRFEGLMDDPINVHGTAVRIVEKVGATSLRCRFMHDQSVGLMFGTKDDTVSYIDHQTMLSRGVGKVASVKAISTEEVIVEFERPIPDSVNIGDALEDVTWTPNFTVRHTEFGTVRARGLLVSTPGKVLIENCRFRSSGAAILIAGDANYWFESGAVTDVTIRKNRFENCNSSPYQFGDAIISIHPEIPRPGSSPFHHGIRIRDNVFTTFDCPVLWAKSVGELSFRDNQVHSSRAYPARNPNAAGLTFIDCENVEVIGNRLDRDYVRNRPHVEGGKPDTIRIDSW